MGTRADFYVGRGKNAEWLGSIGWDGYPDGIERTLLDSRSEAVFRKRLAAFFKGRDDVTLPAQGWPWPWDDSGTTDYAYVFDRGRVYASGFGHKWHIATWAPPEKWYERHSNHKVEFPDMSARKAVTLGKRSGLIVLTST